MWINSKNTVNLRLFDWNSVVDRQCWIPIVSPLPIHLLPSHHSSIIGFLLSFILLVNLFTLNP